MLNDWTIIESSKDKTHVPYYMINEWPEIIEGKVIPFSEWTSNDVKKIMVFDFCEIGGNELKSILPSLLVQTCREIGLSSKMTDKFMREILKRLSMQIEGR